MRFKSEEQRRAVMARLQYARGVKAEKKSRRFTLRSGQQQQIVGLPSGTFSPAVYRRQYHKTRAQQKRRVSYVTTSTGLKLPRVPAEIQRERIQAVARYHIKKSQPVGSMTAAELRKDLYGRAMEAQKQYFLQYRGSQAFRPGRAVRKAVKERLNQLQQSQTV